MKEADPAASNNQIFTLVLPCNKYLIKNMKISQVIYPEIPVSFLVKF